MIDVQDNRLCITSSADGRDPAGRWESGQLFGKREGSTGFGLGLSILRRLCDRHAIDLKIESQGSKTVASITLSS